MYITRRTEQCRFLSPSFIIPIERYYSNRLSKPLAQKAGLPKEARLYTLRHTFATLWMESNEPVKVLQEILGHSRIDQTMNTYAHVMPHIQADAFGRFSRRFSQG